VQYSYILIEGANAQVITKRNNSNNNKEGICSHFAATSAVKAGYPTLF
jgi:hypothetical protein